MSITLKQTIYWGVAALALLMLADPLPDVATMFAVLLIIGVLLTHWSDYASLLTPPGSTTVNLTPPTGVAARKGILS